MMDGQRKMLKLYVDNWAMIHMVVCFNSKIV